MTVTDATAAGGGGGGFGGVLLRMGTVVVVVVGLLVALVGGVRLRGGGGGGGVSFLVVASRGTIRTVGVLGALPVPLLPALLLVFCRLLTAANGVGPVLMFALSFPSGILRGILLNIGVGGGGGGEFSDGGRR